MMKKKGAMSDDEIMGLILGVIAVVILIFLATKLFDSGNDDIKIGLASESYFETFMAEIEKVNEGEIGTFTMWQELDKKGKEDVFLIYFAGKYKYSIGDRTFITYNNNNTICACFWFGDYGNCEEKSCTDLLYPVRYNGELDPWVISSGDQIKIEKKDDEYLITKINEDELIEPEYIPGEVVSYLFHFDNEDFFVDNEGLEYNFVSLVDDEGDWTLFLQDGLDNIVSVQGRDDEIFIDYRGIGEIVVLEVLNEG